MSEIPVAEIERAKDRIVDVIGKHVHLKKAGKNWSACCPFHNEKSPSFTVEEEERFYYCFGCGASGDAIKFLMDFQGVDFRSAVESILGRITLTESYAVRAPVVRAVTCSLPGHAEDREKAAAFIEKCQSAEQHPYLKRHNTAPHGECLTLKGSLIVPLLNNIGEQVNVAAITTKGVKYAAGLPSFGSTAILEPAGEHDGRIILCHDYAHAWRIWWAHSGYCRVLCAMDRDNFLWMLANCKDRFTHVGCDPSEADEHWELGRLVVAVPIDPYQRAAIDVEPIDEEAAEA